VISAKDYRVIGSGTVTRYANGRKEVLPRRGALFPVAARKAGYRQAEQ
jgi:hypothetical protein